MPRQYDLDSDNLYGLASADFPITAYDRPSLMLGNLLRGDIDGMTRSMLSPDTLSPTQMKTFRDAITKGKKPSPLLKTILDISTNPLVIIGLIAALKYPMGTTKALLQIRRGLLPKAAAMSEFVSGIHGALMNLRTVPGGFPALSKFVREKESFIRKWGEEFNSHFVTATATQGMTKAEGYLVAARLDGLHKTTNNMYKILRNEPEYIAFMGSSDVPIAVNLQSKMSPRLISLHDKLHNTYKKIWGVLSENKEFQESTTRSLEKKGYRIGKEVDDYFPRRSRYNKYQESRIRGLSQEEYRRHVRATATERVGREQIQRMGGSFPEEDALRVLETQGAIPKGFYDNVVRGVKDRWATQASRAVDNIWEDVMKLNLDEVAQRREFSGRMMEYYSKGEGKAINFINRIGGKRAAEETLDEMGLALQNARFKGTDAIKSEIMDIGRVMSAPAEYSMNLWDVTEQYINSVAGDYAFHGTGAGMEIKKILTTPGIFKGQEHLRPYLEDGILPHVLGYSSFKQMGRIARDARIKQKILGWVENHPMVEATLGPKYKDMVVESLKKSRSLSSQAIGGQLANWFHLSTLGLNLSATSANSMQTFITTINNVGPQGIYRGLKGFGAEPGLFNRANTYIAAIAKGVNQDAAFQSAFPEFVAEMGSMSKTTNRMLAGDIASSGLPKLFKEKGVWNRIKGAMMFPFSATEAGNQLLAFYSGRAAHLSQNVSQIATAGARITAEANEVGGSLAMLTQFAGGPLGIPKAIMNMNPLWRQYMHFPMRYLSYLHGSLRMGIDPNKMDWGTIGRALAGSTAAYIAGRNLLGIDLSRGLMVGALPLPGYEKASFYPFPLVPPAAGVIGEASRALLTGDTSRLKNTGAMLLPGGTAAYRAYRSLSPRFADYKNPTPDGRISLYNNEGALLGNMTPMELTLRSLGLRSASIAAEAGAAKWLVSQRDRIRGYRREYTQALFENDTRRAENINKEFQKTYPELGPLQIKKSDIRALENRREISRLHRISRGISKDYRPLFEQVIGEASLGKLTEDIQASGIDVLQNYLPQY